MYFYFNRLSCLQAICFSTESDQEKDIKQISQMNNLKNTLSFMKYIYLIIFLKEVIRFMFFGIVDFFLTFF